MTTRRWFEFASTRYRSSGSICPRPSFCVSPSLLLRPVLSVALVISIRPLLSPSLHTTVASSSSLASFLTLGERILSTTLSLPYPVPRPLATAASVHVPPAVSLALSLSRSVYPPSSGARASTAYQSVSVPRSVSAFSHRFSRSLSFSLSRSLAPSAPPRALLSLFLPL